MAIYRIQVNNFHFRFCNGLDSHCTQVTNCPTLARPGVRIPPNHEPDGVTFQKHYPSTETPTPIKTRTSGSTAMNERFPRGSLEEVLSRAEQKFADRYSHECWNAYTTVTLELVLGLVPCNSILVHRMRENVRQTEYSS